MGSQPLNFNLAIRRLFLVFHDQLTSLPAFYYLLLPGCRPPILQPQIVGDIQSRRYWATYPQKRYLNSAWLCACKNQPYLGIVFFAGYNATFSSDHTDTRILAPHYCQTVSILGGICDRAAPLASLYFFFWVGNIFEIEEMLYPLLNCIAFAVSIYVTIKRFYPLNWNFS